MILKNKNKFKPLYKKFLKLRENVQNRKKLLKFRKQKWEKFKIIYLKNLNKKFKLKDQNRYLVWRYPTTWSSYKKRYKNNLILYKKINLFYGGLSRKLIKEKITKAINQKYKKINPLFLKLFETRLDVVLYRAKFSQSIREARQLIFHNKVLVNNKKIKIKSYTLKSGDLITLDVKDSRLIDLSIKRSFIWPIPPKHLIINYKTLQIVFGSFDSMNFSFNFSYYLNLEKILTNYYQY